MFFFFPEIFEIKRTQLFSVFLATVLIGLQFAIGSSTVRDDSDQSRIGLYFNSSALPRWWKTETSVSDSQSAVHASLRYHQWQLHQRRQQEQLHRKKSDAENRKFWLTRNGSPQEPDDSIKETEKEETEESLALLENLVHPEEELLDEINDRQIIQAVIASMAQWNLRKLQKMQRKSDQNK